MGSSLSEMDRLQLMRASGELDLSGRGWTEIPHELRNYPVKILNLDGNNISEVPSWIGDVPSLRTLWLDGNRIAELPPEIGKLINLEDLSLRGNNITVLPPEIGKLAHLRLLNVRDNKLTSLPREFDRLFELKELNLVGNQFTEIPREICQLVRLEWLGMDRNQLTRLPPEIVQLGQLNKLELAGNRLESLPPEIGGLRKLQKLDIARNLLTALPPEIAGLLSDKLILNASGNPLDDPIPDLLKLGTDAIVSYLHSLEDAIPQYEAKVLLVGEGNVGKTSLVAALRGDPFVEGRPTTHGIEIQPLALRHPGFDTEMTVRAWDFGGQEVYRITHQFFFSQRAVYLVVWNAREGQEQNEVEGWLRRIRLRVNRDARALVVATHCDERHPELDFRLLKQAFPELLADQSEVDNRTRRGIAELREKIAAELARLPQMGQLISPRWIAARDEILIRAKADPQISYEEFESICESYQVGKAEALTLARLMHDLGHIIYYSDDDGLRDFVILNPEWLTKAISYVIEDAPTRLAAGVLDHSRLAEIWQDRRDSMSYPPNYHPYFLRLMEKFDVSYRLEDDEHRSLVAQLVPHDRPDLPWDSHMPPSSGTRRLAFSCRFSEPVPGLVAWLTVRHHRASTGKHWRSGVFLRHPIAAYASEAIIELRTPHDLAVDVRAPSPDMFFNVLRDSVEDLVTRRWPGLSYELLIPCPTRARDGAMCKGALPLNGLLGYREQGGMRAPCWECHADHDISELLTGFGWPEPAIQPELDRLQGQLDDVANGISRLEGYAADTADSLRRLLRAVANEVTDCPRLFTLALETPAGMRRLNFSQRYYRLTLWCEQPGAWHPWGAASYSIKRPKQWLSQVGPYIILVSKALRLVVPVAAAVADMVLSPHQVEQAQDSIQLMSALVADLPDLPAADKRGALSLEEGSQLTAAQGQALRGIRALLFDQDALRAFGDLRRVQSASGDFLWICPSHYPEYDPGLPVIPGL